MDTPQCEPHSLMLLPLMAACDLVVRAERKHAKCRRTPPGPAPPFPRPGSHILSAMYLESVHLDKPFASFRRGGVLDVAIDRDTFGFTAAKLLQPTPKASREATVGPARNRARRARGKSGSRQRLALVGPAASFCAGRGGGTGLSSASAFPTGRHGHRFAVPAVLIGKKLIPCPLSVRAINGKGSSGRRTS